MVPWVPETSSTVSGELVLFNFRPYTLTAGVPSERHF